MRYLLILIIVLGVGIACALPNILGYIQLKEIYEPFSYLSPSDIPFDEIMFYASSAAYFKEKLHLPFEIDIYEYKNNPNPRYLLSTIIEGTIGYLLKDLRLGWLVIHFVFPALSSLLAYLLAKKLTNNTWVACFATLVFCTLGFGPRSFINLDKENILQPILFSRISSPAVTLPFLLISLIGLVKTQERYFKIGIILSAIFGGLLFYTYYYYQIAYSFTLVSLTLIYMIRKRWDKFFRMLLIGIGVNIIALPWYVQYFYALKSSPEFVSRWLVGSCNLGVFDIMSVSGICFFLIISYFFWKWGASEDKNQSNKFLDSGYLPIYILILMAILFQFIGFQFFTIILRHHFQQHIINGFTVLILSSTIGNFLVLRYRKYKIILIIAICILITQLFIKQSNVWQYTKDYFKVNPIERVAERLVEKYTTHKDVIAMKNPFLNSVFPARLWRFRFYTFIGFSNISWRENLERYLFIQKIFNQPWMSLDRQLLSEKDTILPPLKTITVPYILTLRQSFCEEERNELRNFYGGLDKEFLNIKKLDYLLCLGPEEENNLLLGIKKLVINVHLVARNRGVSLYRLD